MGFEWTSAARSTIICFRTLFRLNLAHPLMLRAMGVAKKNDRIDAGKIADCPRCDFLPRSATWC